MSSMRMMNERGAVNILLLPLILTAVFLIFALGFGFWAFAGRQDYKDNSDKKSAVAANEAIVETQKVEAIKYAEEAKKPYDTFIGSAAFGNVTINYPKTWSAYVIEEETGNKPLNGYFHPKYVPDTTNADKTFALRIELVQQTYENVISSFSGNLKTGKVTLEPYKLAKVPSVVGSRIEGQITAKKQGSMIILPLRNLTLKIWTESNDYKADLDTHILPNLSFAP